LSDFFSVIWLTGKAQSHILDFDDEAVALDAMLLIEAQSGNHSVSMSSTTLDDRECPPEVKERIDAVIRGRIGLECGRLRLENARLQKVAEEAGELAEMYRTWGAPLVKEVTG
jgi:hypothetical protein